MAAGGQRPPLAIWAVAAEHEVTGYDIDANRIKRPEVGETYVEDVAVGERNEVFSATVNPAFAV